MTVNTSFHIDHVALQHEHEHGRNICRESHVQTRDATPENAGVFNRRVLQNPNACVSVFFFIFSHT